MPSQQVGVWTLVREELRTLPRNLFALGGLAAVGALLAILNAVGFDGPEGMETFLVFAWIVAPLVVAVVLASRVANARRTRFVDSLYTTPLTQPTWLAAQAIVGLALLAAVFLLVAPFVLVFAAHLGWPPTLLPTLLSGLGVGLFAIALGLFCGVVVGDAGPGAASGLASTVGIASFVALIAQGILLQSPVPSATQSALLRVVHVSPLTLAIDASGLGIFGATPTSTAPAMIGLAALALGFFAAAWIAFTRQQSPVAWEPSGGRSILVLLVVAALLTPVALASADFREDESRRGGSFQNAESHFMTLVPRSAPIDDESLTLLRLIRSDPLDFGKENALDALVFLRVPPGATIRDLDISFDGGDDLVVAGGLHVARAKPDGLAHETKGFGFGDEPRGPEGPVFRVPVTIRPIRSNALLEGDALLRSTVSFVVDGKPIESHAAMTITSDVPGASTQLLLAGSILPIACLSGVVTRKIRTR